jgi:hypothetical protein
MYRKEIIYDKKIYEGGMGLNDWKEQMLKLSEEIGKTMMTIDKAMAKFMRTDTFKNLVDFLSNLPDDIQETELFNNVKQLEKSEITCAEIEWIQEIFGYKSYDMNIQMLHNKENKSKVDQYVLSIIESNTMLPREKIVVLLAHFEEIVFQTVTYERKTKDTVKKIISKNVYDIHEMEMKNYRKILLAAIVFIVFSNTDNYKNEIDMRIPFRNNILHRGTLAYSDNDIKEAYEILVYFIAELTMMEERF